MTTPSEFETFAFQRGLMLPCILCGKPVGGRCPPCDRVICYACTVPVRIATNAIAWRCKECAAEIVLKGEGMVTQRAPDGKGGTTW